VKLGILRTDTVRPEWAVNFGQYPDMFVTLMSRADPSMEFVTYDVENGQYPDDIDERTVSIRMILMRWMPI